MPSDEAAVRRATSDERPPGPTLARLSRPRSTDPVTLAVVADPHLAVGATGSWKVYHRTRARLRTAVTDANDRGVDFALVAGDLTRDGRPAEFAAAEAVLDALEVPWAAIPGNHDVPKDFDAHDGIPPAAFAERFAPGLPFQVDVGTVTLFGLDTASAPDDSLRDTWGGRVSAAQLDWLDDRLPTAETPVVVCHHNLSAVPENPGGKWSHFSLDDASAVRECLTTHDVPLAVTAHHHVPAVARHGPTTELLAPATCSFPQATLLLDVGPGGTTARLVPLADRRGVAEAHSHARTGKPLGRGILSLVESRLDDLPLLVTGPEV